MKTFIIIYLLSALITLVMIYKASKEMTFNVKDFLISSSMAFIPLGNTIIMIGAIYYKFIENRLNRFLNQKL